jgi:hypothetical protein
MPRLIAIFVISLLLVSSSWAGQERSRRKVIELEGQVQNADGSPVVLSDARFVVGPEDEADKSARITELVKVRNVSGRAIRKLHVKFVEIMNRCGLGIGTTVVGDLGPDEVRDRVQHGYTGDGMSDSGKFKLLVVATGAEFDNGEFWAANRAQWGANVMMNVNKRGSGLNIGTSKFEPGSYTVSMSVRDPQIVSYRLGLVRDAVDSFEVTIGESVMLKQSERTIGAIVIDQNRSVSDRKLLQSGSLPGALKPTGPCPHFPIGIGVFVAEAIFSDGRRWVQDPGRDALLWDH